MVLAIVAVVECFEYYKKNEVVNYKNVLSSPFSPSISIIAPSYNEELNIVENVRSLLSNHYSNYDVIIVNDGSKDNSMGKLIDVYELRKVDMLLNTEIETKTIRGIYKSSNRSYEKLIIVDKENGGKSDALNAGLNVSTSKYVLCVDVDCVLVEDALQKIIKPFLEHSDRRVIATGGVIRIGNACQIKGGRVMEVNLPEKLIERAQILEYFRSFLLGRMAWSRLDGLLVISGAFGLFDRQIVIAAGAYDTKTVGEDMELIVRMRRYMREQKLKYRVSFIPDPLCWTEAPDNHKIFISQRNRWTRGTIETLKKHRKIGFNPRYGSLGLISYPYWLFFERLAPLIEFGGVILVIALALTGNISWTYFWIFSLLIWFFSVLLSSVAIFAEELTYHQYKNRGDGFRLILTTFLEPLFFHPVVVYAAIRGNLDYYFVKNKHWGKMERKGLGQKK